MNSVSGTTDSEKKMCKAIQSVLKEVQDGSLGPSTISSLAVKLDAPCFPLTIKIYNNPVIICKDIIPFRSNFGLIKYRNSISGSFNDGSAPCSILVTNRHVVRANSCHYWDDGSPETVIYKNIMGDIRYTRVKSVYDINDTIAWAVGGMGLLKSFDPKAEGFTGRFSDVLRKTNHTVLASKLGVVYLCYLTNMSAVQINNWCKKCMFDCAILLDGGHVAAMNGDEQFSRINMYQKQLYVIQAV